MKNKIVMVLALSAGLVAANACVAADFQEQMNQCLEKHANTHDKASVLLECDAAGGKLTEGGVAVGGAAVTLLRGTSATKLAKFASATTTAAGSWAKSGKTAGKVTYFKATATVKERDATSTGCAQPLPASVAPGGCVSATLGAWTATSPVAKFKP